MKNCFLVILMVFIFLSCGNKYNEEFAVGRNEQENVAVQREKSIEKSLTMANEIISVKEKQSILSYIERRGWNMENKSGIYVQITKQGEGKVIDDSCIMAVKYDCFLINGQRYGNSSSQTDTFNVRGDTKIPFGLMSAVKGMQKKTQARIIIPSNLAFTISDEGEKFSQDNTLIYIVEIKDVIGK